MSSLFVPYLREITAEPSNKLSSWLYCETSLTDKLAQLTGDVQLTVLSQRWTMATWWDNFVLAIREQIVEREILMKSHDKPYWYARSVIPLSCYELDFSFFNRLENESLKNLIFAEPKVDLVRRDVYAIDADCLEYYWVKKHIGTDLPDVLWLRLTTMLFLKKQLFYLIEALFPSLQDLER